MSGDDSERVEAGIRDVIEPACGERFGEKVLLSSWVVIAEVVTERDGERSVFMMTDGHTAPWNAYGMTTWALDQFAAGHGGGIDP